MDDDLYFEPLGLCMQISALPEVPFDPIDPLVIALEDETLMLLQTAVSAADPDARIESFTHLLTPGAAEWQAGTGLMTPRVETTLTRVQGRGALVAGGLVGNERPLLSVEQFDNRQQQWNAAAGLSRERRRHAAVDLDGQLIVLGGISAAAELTDVEAWPGGPDAPAVPNLPAARAAFHAANVGGTLLVVGGEVNGVPSGSSAQWTGDGDWTPTLGAALPVFLEGVAFTADDSMAVIGGGDAPDPVTAVVEPTDRLFVWRPDTGWVEDRLARARKFHTITSLGDGLLLVFGSSNRIELIDTVSGEQAEVIAPADLSVQRRRHAAVALSDRSAVIVGGLLGGERLSDVLKLRVYDHDPVGDRP